LQDPQEDNIRNAKDLILLAPDSMEYYREQKQQEDEKAKREQAIADACARQKQAQWEAKKQELSTTESPRVS
jgi:beta-lactamase superfamily II metal-dependent hydrolase